MAVPLSTLDIISPAGLYWKLLRSFWYEIMSKRGEMADECIGV